MHRRHLKRAARLRCLKAISTITLKRAASFSTRSVNTRSSISQANLPNGPRRALIERDIKDCTDAQPRWDAVWNDAVAAEKLVDPARKNYFQAEMLAMVTINRESNRMLFNVASAMKDAEDGNKTKAEADTAAALLALDRIRTSMSTAEYGKWKNWYRGDWLTGVYRTRELVQDYANHLKDPMAKLPAPASWSGWEAYFHIMEYEGDRSVDVH
jgi:Ni/Co efflux regulator RcnB